MSDRPRFFDDLAGVAGGAISALAGLREEAEAMVRARIDEAIRRLDLVRREELEAVPELAANARAGQEAAEAQARRAGGRIAALEARAGRASAATPELPPSAPGSCECRHCCCTAATGAYEARLPLPRLRRGETGR